MTNAMIVLCTCASEHEALKLAEMLVDGRFAACVNVLPGLRSIYRWQGNVEKADETLLLIKTTQERLGALRDRISELHSYDTPEIIAIPITEGSDKYLAWLSDQVHR